MKMGYIRFSLKFGMRKAILIFLIAFAYSLTCKNALCDQTREALSQGGFEGGGTAYWSFGYYPGGATTSSGPFQGANAFDGQWYAYFGDKTTTASTANGYAYQYLLPRPETNAKEIDVSFYLNVTSQDTSGAANDTLSVILRVFDDNLNFLYDITLATYSNKDRESDGNPKTYHPKSLPYTVTSAVAGHWVTLLFKVQTDATYATTFRVDDVSAKVITPDPQYIVTPSAGSGGTISPSTARTVAANGSVSFTATPDSGNDVLQWFVGGTLRQTGGTTFTLSPVTADTTVSVTFTPKLYNLNVVIDGQGAVSLSPPGGRYAAGTQVTATATPQGGFQFSEWTGTLSGRSETFTVSKGGSDETISVKFIQILTPGNLNIQVANSTPSLGFSASTPSSWFTFWEFCDSLNTVWNVFSVIEGNDGTSVVTAPTSPNGNVCLLRTVYYPKVTTAPFLDFPIHGVNVTPSTAQVTAIFDHSTDNQEVHLAYEHDNVIRTTIAATLQVPQEHRIAGEHYAPINGNSVLPPYINYVGVAGQGGAANLQYDGHPGYDFYFAAEAATDVYAAADGDVLTGGGADDCTATGLDVANFYMKHRHALIIKHNNDYCTVYMHLSAIDPNYADTTDSQFWKPKAVHINRGDHIGKVGKYLTDCYGNVDTKIGFHLHFEVWRKDGAKWYFADPYGFQWSDGTKSFLITPYLWTSF